jgi:pilus assembly protein CpaB
MNLKTWIPLILAVLLGTVALVVARKVIRPSGSEAAQVRMTEVVVASHDVAVGRELTAEDLAVNRVPAGNVPSQAFAKPQELVGRAVTTPIVKGQAVLDTLLAPEGSGAGLQAMVPPGMRAITVEVNEVTGVAGMLTPGARVDVICTVQDAKSQQPLTRTILQNIKVLASGRQLSRAQPQDPTNGQPAPPPASNVTLLVTQRQAQALQLAAQGSRPWLVLRSPRDDDDDELESTRMSDLRGEDEFYGPLVTSTPTPVQPTPAVVAVAPPPPTSQPTTAPTTMPAKRIWVMRVIRGGAVTEMAFPAPPPKAPPVQDPGLQLLPQTPQTPAVTGTGDDLQEEAQ